MASAFWMKQKGKRVLGYKYRGADGKRVGPLRARGCRTLAQARRLAEDLERKNERVRLGLEVLPSEEKPTFGVLFDAWWDGKGKRRRSDSKLGLKQSVEKHLKELRPLLLTAATAGYFADRLEKLLDAKLDAKEIGPQTRNHLRSTVFSVFEYARDLKRRTWVGENPIEWVSIAPIPTPEYELLRRSEVLRVLDAFPDPRLGAPWRWVAAMCLYTGSRPGEPMGARKKDFDLDDWIWTIRHSWEAPWPKNRKPRPVPIPPELRPHVRAAMKSSPNEFLFPRADGKPFKPDTRRGLVKRLRRALAKAGLVLGYEHACRRCKRRVKLAPDSALVASWRHADADQRVCPNCGMKLWITAIPRPMRFYDLRHTHATLLRKSKVEKAGVGAQLGHHSARMTDVYDHSDIMDHRGPIDAAMTFGAAAPALAALPEGDVHSTTGSPQPVTPPTASAPDADPASPASEQFPPVSKR